MFLVRERVLSKNPHPLGPITSHPRPDYENVSTRQGYANHNTAPRPSFAPRYGPQSTRPALKMESNFSWQSQRCNVSSSNNHKRALSGVSNPFHKAQRLYHLEALNVSPCSANGEGTAEEKDYDESDSSHVTEDRRPENRLPECSLQENEPDQPEEEIIQLDEGQVNFITNASRAYHI